MTRKKVKKAWKIVKIALRLFFCLVFLHWKYFTVYDDYYYCSAINRTENHQQISCDREIKSIKEIRDDVLNKIREWEGKNKDPEEVNETDWKEGEDLIKKVKDKQEKLAKKWWFQQSEEEKNELTRCRKEYQDWLEEIKKKITKRIKDELGKLEKKKINITLLDTRNETRSWFERAWKDPVKFLFLNQLNRVSVGLKGHLWLEIIFKLLIIELFLLGISYPNSLEKIQKNFQKLENPALSVEEKAQIAKKIPILLTQGAINFFLYLLGNFTCFFHPLAFDRMTGLFEQKAHSIWIVFLFFCNLLFSLGREFLQRRRILTKSEIKTFLVNILAPTLLSFSFMFFFFSAERTHGNNLLLFCSLLVNFLVSVVRGYFDPQLKRN